MKFLKIFLFYLFATLFIKQNIAYSSIKSSIIVKVGSEIVTSYELENKIKSILFFSNKENNQENIDRVKNSAINSLVNQKLMLDELKKYNYDNQKIDTSKYIKDLTLKLNMPEENLKRNFKLRGIDYDTYLEEIEINLKWQQLMYEIYSSKINIDQNEIDNELNRLIKDRQTLEEYKLAELTLDLTDGKLLEGQLEEIELNIINEGFEETAKRFSSSSSAIDGGNLGWVNSANLSDNILKALVNLNPGEISNPIRIQNSILFLKLIEKKEFSKIKNIDKEKLKKSLMNAATNQLFNMHSKNHLSKKKNLTVIKFINE